ncbi:MAG TPA: SRPBCC family protein [Candidatus Eisenbacteria bacterium]|nr:SRPBCC family protein [Candidatus Eisenbacteria bacterium]
MVLLSGAAESGDVTVELDDSTRACGVQGSFIVPVSAVVAWVVLTDYDHIAGFVTSMVSSRAERRSDGSLRVHQVATGSVMAGVVRRRVHVELDTREEPPRRIAFTDVLGKDFSSYVGEWLIVPMPDTGAVYVTYRLTAEPHGAIARAFCRGALRKTTRELLEQVRAEMLRRRDDN